MFDLNIDKGEPITSSNFSNEIPSDIITNKHDILDYNWKLIPYDYDKERNDMAYYELIVEGRNFNPREKSNYDKDWELIQKEDDLWYMKTANNECRHNLTDVMREEVSYHVGIYAQYNMDMLLNYDSTISTWDLFDLAQKTKLVTNDLKQTDLSIPELAKMPVHTRISTVQNEIDNESVRADVLELTSEMNGIIKQLIKNERE